jgi:hypothetical protein
MHEGSLRKVFLTIPQLASQLLNGDQVQTVISRAGVRLIRQEIVTLFRVLDPQKTGVVKLTKVLKFIMDNNHEY